MLENFKSTPVVTFVLSLLKQVDLLLSTSCGLTHAQFRVLLFLNSHGPHSQQEIASHQCSTAAAISRLTETLTKKHYVKRHHNPVNRRQNVLDITELGKQELAQAIAIIKSQETKLYQHINNQDLQVFLKVSQKLQDLMVKK